MFLGIDIGTSAVKTVILGADGQLVAQATAPLWVERSRPLWSEQAPEAWWQAADQAVLRLPSAARSGVLAVGLTGQMHSATLLGDHDVPLRNAILWNDGRSFAECAALEAAEPRCHAITGNLAMPGFTAPKLLWVRDNEPEIFAATRTVLLPKDYVRLRMTGDKASDMSDSAGTLWLDCAARTWSEAMLEASGLTCSQMPALYEGNELTGTLLPEVAARWGMAKVPVAAGGSDNAAGAIGVGVVTEGDALLSLGTSGVIFVATADFRPNPARAVHAFCHALPGMWHQMSVHLSAASCVDWAATATGLGDTSGVFAAAASAGVGKGREIFLPYLSGERTPHNDPHVRGAFLGLDHDTNPARLAAAVLEGVAFAHADGLAALREAGTQVDRLVVIGGGARVRHWGRILASAMNVTLVYLEGGEVGPAKGAARLARMALTGEGAAEVCPSSQVVEEVAPEQKLFERLTPRLARFRAAYSALKSI